MEETTAMKNNKLKKGKFTFFVFLTELDCFVWFFIIGAVLSIIHIIGLGVIGMKSLNFFVIFWGILGFLVYVITYMMFGKETGIDFEFLSNRLFPYYIPIADADDGYLHYPHTESFAKTSYAMDEFFDDYWKNAAKTKTKTSIGRFLLIYLIFFGIMIAFFVVTLVICYRDAAIIKNAVDAFNNAPENVKGFTYRVTAVEGEDLEMILAYSGAKTVTGWEFTSCAYVVGNHAFFTVVLICTLFHRLVNLLSLTCIRCGNVGVFTSHLEYYDVGSHYVHSSEEHDEQIGTIEEKGLCGTTKEIANVYVTRKDHYRTKVTTTNESYGCGCPFCGRKKKISFSSSYTEGREYDHSSY